MPALELSIKVAEQQGGASSSRKMDSLVPASTARKLEEVYRMKMDRSRLVLFVDIQYGRQDFLSLYGNGKNTYRRNIILAVR